MNVHPVQRILFVCLGNICRSAMAEGIMRHKIEARGLGGQICCNSAGFDRATPGMPADPRAVATARQRGVVVETIARGVRSRDYVHFDLILAMDRSNLAALRAGCPKDVRHKLHLMRAFDRPPVANGEISDPYYGTQADFEPVFETLDRCTDSLIEHYRNNLLGE